MSGAITAFSVLSIVVDYVDSCCLLFVQNLPLGDGDLDCPSVADAVLVLGGLVSHELQMLLIDLGDPLVGFFAEVDSLALAAETFQLCKLTGGLSVCELGVSVNTHGFISFIFCSKICSISHQLRPPVRMLVMKVCMSSLKP